MACVTLKRPLEFDPLHHSPSAASSCSPRPHKRRRCLPMCIPASQVTTQHTSSFSASSFAQLPHTLNSTASSAFASQSPYAASSPIAGASPSLLKGDIAQYVQEEIRRLKMRHLLNTPPRPSTSTDFRSTMDVEGGEDSSSPSNSPPRTTSPALATPLPASSPTNKEKALFSFRQVNQLCSQLLRERESRIREEYDNVLAHELAEQYNRCVRFTTDQIHKQLAKQDLPSYMS